MGIIYKAENKVNGKVYIGKTVKKLRIRRNHHFSCAKNNRYNMYFHRAIRKYGKENFIWEVLDFCDDEDDLNYLEQEYIKMFDSYNNGYNLTKGGEGTSGRVFSEETRQKMRNAKKDKYCGINNPMYGFKGELSPNYGKKHKKESIKKQSLKVRKGNIFGFNGGYYAEKTIKPWRKVWRSTIFYNNTPIILGLFHDPLSCQIVYLFVWSEIYGE